MSTVEAAVSRKTGYGTITQISEFLSISRSGIYKLLDDGLLPSVKLRGARRIPWDAVYQLLEKAEA